MRRHTPWLAAHERGLEHRAHAGLRLGHTCNPSLHLPERSRHERVLRVRGLQHRRPVRVLLASARELLGRRQHLLDTIADAGTSESRPVNGSTEVVLACAPHSRHAPEMLPLSQDLLWPRPLRVRDSGSDVDESMVEAAVKQVG
eukprot:143467-Rhodomonas_salina.1